jgi:hypothetical protein
MTMADMLEAPAQSPPLSAPSMAVIRAQLSRTRKIWRLSESLSRGTLWCLALLLTAVVLAGLDNLLRLPSELRLILSLGILLGGIASLAAWVLRPLFWKISDQAAAVYLERKLQERENLLINAVQLSGKADDAPAFSKSMIEHIVQQAGSRAAEMSLAALWDKRRLKRLALAASGAALLVVLYAALLPAYAKNAFQRFTRPLSGVPPISQTHVFVTPSGKIELFAGDKLTVHGLASAARGSGPGDAVLIAHVDGASHRIPMARVSGGHLDLLKQADEELSEREKSAGRAQQAFVYEFPTINKSFSFHIVCGDGESSPCSVVVRERPGVQDLSLEIQPPSYTGLAKSKETSASGMVHALNGSQVTLDFKPTMPLSSGKLILPEAATPLKSGAGIWSATFIAEKECTYALTLTSADGVEAARAFEGQITLKADALPTAAFENQALNIAAVPGATVPLAVRAQDDYGLKSLRLVVQQGLENSDDAKNAKPLKEWKYVIPGPKSVNELYPLTLNPATYPAGGTYAVYAEVLDHCPNGKRLYRSAPLVVRVLTPEQMELPSTSPFASIFNRIQELIDAQTKNRGKTVTIREFLAETIEKNLLEKRTVIVRDAQGIINKSAEKLLADMRGAKDERVKSASKMAAEIESIIKNPMAKALVDLNGLMTAQKDKTKAPPLLQSVEAAQTEVINRLTALLGTVAKLDKEKKDSQADLKDDQDSQRLRDKLEAASEKVKEFIDQQKQIVKATEELEQKKPDDLTEDEKKLLGDMAKTEKDWAKFFKEKATDLSKVPNQDFSNSKLAEEFNEVFQEVQKAAEALQGKNKEVAVKAEQGGLELAKQLETNLEKWLPDTRDSTKWTMEEPKGEFDVPLADLPKELEDIVGELVDEEEKMTDDVQDASSSWMDSADKGAGWDAADGPISNMSAKGVTGNQLPNKQEVGGRSGEGRNGKSSGQFVEETAQGKGGPQTPTRLTQDAFEQGNVKDTSKDAQGGSTGGGKESGMAGAGLRGQPPPQTMQKLERLQGAQAEIRQKAEKVATQLKAYHLPSSDCEEAVRRMKLIEENLKAGKGFDLRQAHTSVIDSLKESQKVVGFQAEVNRERTRDLPKNVRNKIISGMQTKAPQGYQDLMEAYFKALVEPDKK